MPMSTTRRRQVLLGLGPMLGALYAAIVLLTPPPSTSQPIYRVVRQITGGDTGLAIVFAVICLCQLLGCLSTAYRTGFVALVVALSLWTLIGVSFVWSLPGSLGPGLCIPPVAVDVFLLRFSTIARVQMARRRRLT